jgi:hypothetical protein
LPISLETGKQTTVYEPLIKTFLEVLTKGW